MIEIGGATSLIEQSAKKHACPQLVLSVHDNPEVFARSIYRQEKGGFRWWHVWSIASSGEASECDIRACLDHAQYIWTACGRCHTLVMGDTSFGMARVVGLALQALWMRVEMPEIKPPDVAVPETTWSIAAEWVREKNQT